MRTEFVDQPIVAFAVTERHQPLREQLHAYRRTVVFRQLLGQKSGGPVPTKQLAHRGSRTRPGDQFVLFRSKHLSPLSRSNGCDGMNLAEGPTLGFDFDQTRWTSSPEEDCQMKSAARRRRSSFAMSREFTSPAERRSRRWLYPAPDTGRCSPSARHPTSCKAAHPSCRC